MNPQQFFRVVSEIGDINFWLIFVIWVSVNDNELSVENALSWLKDHSHLFSSRWFTSFRTEVTDRKLNINEVIPLMVSEINYAAFQNYKTYISQPIHTFNFLNYMMYYTKFDSCLWRNNLFPFECLINNNYSIVDRLSEKEYVVLLESFFSMKQYQMESTKLNNFLNFLCHEQNNIKLKLNLDELLFLSKLDWCELHNDMYSDIIKILYNKEQLPYLIMEHIIFYFNSLKYASLKTTEMIDEIALCLEQYTVQYDYYITINKMSLLLDNVMKIRYYKRKRKDEKMEFLKMKDIYEVNSKNRKIYEIISVNPILKVLVLFNNAFHSTDKYNILQMLTERMNHIQFKEIQFLKLYLDIRYNFHCYTYRDIDELELINGLIDVINFKNTTGEVLFPTNTVVLDILKGMYKLSHCWLHSNLYNLVIFLESGELKMSINQLIFLIHHKIKFQDIIKINKLIAEKRLLLNYSEILEFVHRFTKLYTDIYYIIECMMLLKSKKVEFKKNYIYFTKELSIDDFFRFNTNNHWFVQLFVSSDLVQNENNEYIWQYWINTDQLIEASKLQIKRSIDFLQIQNHINLMKNTLLPNLTLEMLKYIIVAGYTINEIVELLTTITNHVASYDVSQQKVINEQLSDKLFMISLLGKSLKSFHFHLIFDNEKLMYLFHIFDCNQLIKYCLMKKKANCFSKLIETFYEQELKNFKNIVERKLVCSNLPSFVSKIVYEYLDISSLVKIYKLV